MTEPKKIKIKLLKPHTHAGRDYLVGEILKLTVDNAEWLISKKTAEEVK